MAEPFHAFIQNLTVATTHGAAVVSLPRSQVEMADWDMQWQDRITKVIRRVAKDLIANDEAEISEVVQRRLFGDAGARGLRRMAAGEPPAELPERFAHPAAGPGRHASCEDRRVRGPGGDFGPASGRQPDGGYGRTWFGEPVPAEEIAFDSGVFLFRKDRAAAPDIIR